MTLIEYVCQLRDNVVSFKHVESKRGINITFMRTVRVPDNHHFNNLPPGLGKFPLYRVNDYADKLPVSMVTKGGLFMPMYQREAMYINFSASQPFMVKIYAGGVNIVSGENFKEDNATKERRAKLLANNKSIQDYVVPPQQPWVDGIVSSAGVVKQFVAMPVGQGYSVEAQLTGEENVGGLQIEITPAVPPNKARYGNPANSITVFVKAPYGEMIELNVCASDTIQAVKDKIEFQMGVPARLQRLSVAGRRPQNDLTLADQNIQKGSVIEMHTEMTGGGYLELSLAAGGFIRQVIRDDFYDPVIWRRDLTIAFNIQIVNSLAFKQITGQDPPETPVRQELCEQYGIKFFKMLEEPTEICGNFNGVKSIAELDGVADPQRSFPTIHLDESGHVLPSDDDLVSTLVDDQIGLINHAGPFLPFRTLGDLLLETQTWKEQKEKSEH